MKNSYSNIFPFNKKILNKTIKVLNKGSLVGLPTETVYGLAGNAYSKKAVAKIFQLKGRSKFNPLIVHYYDIKQILNDVIINNHFIKLYKKLCPGPITFILKKNKNSRIHSLASAKLETVAIRFPEHKVTRSILKNINYPLAMPSANISSNVSPVCAHDVHEEFKKKIQLIVDGGQSKIGIESTVVDLSSKIKILRPGIISSKEISKVLKKKVKNVKHHRSIKAPGALKFHYSPGIPIKMNAKNSLKNHAFIIFGKRYKNTTNSFNLSKKSNLNEAAKNLYKIFRKIKKLRYKKINIVKIPNKEVGIAINDRIKKASGTK